MKATSTEVTKEQLDSSWIQTRSGIAFTPLEPKVKDINILDIAWALSMQCRYAGHTRCFYSVAEHSVHISNALPPEYALQGLLHDAPEAYMIDIPKPIKWIAGDYCRYEAKLMEAIAQRFDLPPETPAIIKEYDYRILHNEKAYLMGEGDREWGLTGEPLPDVVIKGWSHNLAYARFLSRFYQLTGIETDWDEGRN